jgi:hypothetical protein
MIAEAFALQVLASPTPHEPMLPPHVIAVEQVDLGTPLAGADYRLIAEAARHPRLRGINLTCYRIYVYQKHGVRAVSFVPTRDREVVRPREIIFLPPDPACPSLTFEMNRRGHVARVILSRD